MLRGVANVTAKVTLLLKVEKPSQDFNSFFDGATNQAVIILCCLDKKKAHPFGRLYLDLKLAFGLIAIPESIVISSGVDHGELVDFH
jgi:hypothetical protein